MNEFYIKIEVVRACRSEINGHKGFSVTNQYGGGCWVDAREFRETYRKIGPDELRLLQGKGDD